MIHIPALERLNTLVNMLKSDLFTLGVSICGLVGVIAIITIVLNFRGSASKREERWGFLTLVFICAGLLGAFFYLLSVVLGFGAGLAPTN